jgi:hypothetical protein
VDKNKNYDEVSNNTSTIGKGPLEKAVGKKWELAERNGPAGNQRLQRQKMHGLQSRLFFPLAKHSQKSIFIN